MSVEHGNVPWIEPRTYAKIQQLVDGYRCPKELTHDAGEIFAGSYDVPGLRFEKPPVIFDIGANCGAYTRWVIDRFPGAQVQCYEPNPEAFEILLQNVRHLRLEAKCHPVAIGASTCKKILHKGKHNLGEASFHDLGAQLIDRGVFVNVASAESLGDCDVIKVDTEGCEVEILTAYLKDPTRGVHPQVVSFEFHREADRRHLDALLYEMGYSLARGMVQYPSIGVLNYVHQSAKKEK